MDRMDKMDAETGRGWGRGFADGKSSAAYRAGEIFERVFTRAATRRARSSPGYHIAGLQPEEARCGYLRLGSSTIILG